jgi:glycosyltransferase involved in cell wall biosynthesis
MNPDAVIVMFAGDFVNTKNIFELYRNTNARVFWLMYDMAPFTGGCHYAWDCNGYRERCGRCPGLYSDDPEDISNKNLLFKKKYIGKTGIEVIAASEWQFRQARSSYLFSDKLIHKILLSVDPELFAMADKNEARIRMGIPEGRKIIFFGSVYMSHRRKGMQYLLESLKILKEKVAGSLLDEKILLLIAGREMEEIESLLAFPFHFLGFVNNTTGIASAFQAADLFLCPSIEDSGPSMINQSLMCGTPVVSFEMGVSPDLVKSGQTGYLARLKESSDMAQGLYDVLSADDRTYERMAKNCRQLAIDLCSPEKQLDSIEKLLQTN